MKKQVKLIASALVFSMVFALCSCNGGNTKETETEAPETTTTTTVETTAEPTPTSTPTPTPTPIPSCELIAVSKVMADCIGKDYDSSIKAFEEFLGCKLDDITPSTTYDGRTMYDIAVDIEIDGVPYKYLSFYMDAKNTDKIDSIYFASKLESKDDIEKAFDDFCKKLQEAYGKPTESYPDAALNLINYKISKKVGFSICEYFQDSGNGFTISVFSK